jgi:hypothetical protein
LVDSQKAKEATRDSGVAQVHDMRVPAGKRPTPVSA